jgi:ribosome assembly protein YihI (activator of Der GTPase)
MKSQKSGSKAGSRAVKSRDTKRTGGNKAKFDRVLSKKAISLGEEFGITAEFICQQTSEQSALEMSDLIKLFNLF